ncbi:uncharacterized protein BX663DRAFT_259784 [Cokeromyces recurvatus]|uniref:uncharacterized protein n=1 Tax=Cokeromyces recurvatus TaxID=90255 RepID=UPI00221FA6E6|nr:uncharacterized protein BX663DRAFT_259784 [Cokeromyces recurvatus]KAI7898485.1 hypothetical protein BX663DRAFT_259784 [Cokeromyces recurvatus]
MTASQSYEIVVVQIMGEEEPNDKNKKFTTGTGAGTWLVTHDDVLESDGDTSVWMVMMKVFDPQSSLHDQIPSRAKVVLFLNNNACIEDDPLRVVGVPSFLLKKSPIVFMTKGREDSLLLTKTYHNKKQMIHIEPLEEFNKATDKIQATLHGEIIRNLIIV